MNPSPFAYEEGYHKLDSGLELRGYAKETRESHIRRIRRFCEYLERPPETATDGELQEYLLFLMRDKEYSRGSMIATTSALRAFYRIVCGRSTDSLRDVLPLRKMMARLPRAYSTGEIARLLSADGMRLNQRTMLITLYATGLRVGELCQLRVADIITSRMQIHVRRGKNGRERYTMLSAKLLNVLRNYWRVYRPGEWLFPSPFDEAQPVGRASPHRAFSRAVKIAGLSERGGIHSLRHSFATHMYEAGVSLPVLQALLGHSRLSSTMVYLHASQGQLEHARSPLDLIDIGPGTIQNWEASQLFA